MFTISAFFMIIILITFAFMTIMGMVEGQFDEVVFMVFSGAVLLAKAAWFGGEKYQNKVVK
jgi:ABC-type transport system involved in multi-copper enzyme maturation permease subunit